MTLVLGKKMLNALKSAAGSSDMYYGYNWDLKPGLFNRLEKLGLVESYQPHNLAHKVKAVITQKGKEQLALQSQPVKVAKKPKYEQKPKKPKVTSEQILELWDEIEEGGTAEQAALSVACEMLGIELEDAYDIMAEGE